MFHTHDHWYFERLDNSSVRITKRAIRPNGDLVVEQEHVVPADSWCSVIASMSAAGEENGGFYAAQRFHHTKRAGMNFGEALELLKLGREVARAGWNGKGMWLRIFNPYADREFKITEAPDARGTLLPHIVMKTVDNGLVPWLASQTDMLASDWGLVS